MFGGETPKHSFKQMIAQEKVEKLHLVFSALPQEAQDWLGSEEAARLTEEINSRHGLTSGQEYLIPELLFRLVTDDLAPSEFTAALKDALKLDLETSRVVTKEIREKILEPIAQPLGILGIDLGQMAYVNLTPQPPTAPAPSAPPPTINQPPSFPPPDQPFIIHQEGVVAPIGPIRPINPIGPTGRTPPANPPKVIIERVVHYNPHLTPLTRMQPQIKVGGKIKVPKSRWFV